MARPGLIVVAAVLIALGRAGSAAAQDPPAETGTGPGAEEEGAHLFAAGAKVGKTLYISGKGDYKPNAEFPEKVENCLNEIRKTLQSAGLDMRHVVKSFVYLEDRDKYAELNPIYAKFFPEDPPARTTLGVAQVPGPSRLEITVHRLHRPRREEADRRPARGPSRSARASWRATRSTSPARAISSPAAAIPRPSRSRSARR